MIDYYDYFVKKGNHPNKDSILLLEEELNLKMFSHEDALFLGNTIVCQAKNRDKNVGIRIDDSYTIFQYIMDGMSDENCISWLNRKINMVKVAKHSSYYAFLDNIESHLYDKYIYDENYAICGGGFPIIVNDEIIGVIAVSGLRPHEDHEMIIEALRKLKKKQEEE